MKEYFYGKDIDIKLNYQFHLILEMKNMFILSKNIISVSD